MTSMTARAVLRVACCVAALTSTCHCTSESPAASTTAVGSGGAATGATTGATFLGGTVVRVLAGRPVSPKGASAVRSAGSVLATL